SDPRVHRVVLVARQADLSRCESLRARFSKLNSVVAGGDVRHLSEFAGLRALAAKIDAGEVDTVLVHDAVRPFATHALVDRLLAGIDQTIGCIPGLPAGRATALVANGWIAGYPPNLWTVQTPQAFQATWLLEAHNKAARQEFIGTDTASAAECPGRQLVADRVGGHLGSDPSRRDREQQRKDDGNRGAQDWQGDERRPQWRREPEGERSQHGGSDADVEEAVRRNPIAEEAH